MQQVTTQIVRHVGQSLTNGATQTARPFTFGDKCQFQIYDRAGCIQLINQRRDQQKLSPGHAISLAKKSEQWAGHLQRLAQQNHADWHDTSRHVQKKVISQQSVSALGSSDRKKRNGKHDLDPRRWLKRGTETQDGFADAHGFAPEVKQMRQAPPIDATAVVYQHWGVTSVSKQSLYVLIWICHTRRLQLGNEARTMQQGVRRKPTQELLR